MSEHVHTPELRRRKDYDPAVIKADVLVCAECEQRLCVKCGRATMSFHQVWCHDCGREVWYGGDAS